MTGNKRHVSVVLDVLMGLCALAGAAALVLANGFAVPPVPRGALAAALSAISGAMVLERLLRVALAPEADRPIRRYWLDLAMIVAAAVAMLLSRALTAGGTTAPSPSPSLSPGATIPQLYILFVLLLRAGQAGAALFWRCRQPLWMLLGGLVLLILVGSGLLMLPAAAGAATGQMFFIDALFTSASAVCLTSLAVRQTATEFSTFGQVVILALVQAGALALMTFGSLVAVRLGRALSWRPVLAGEPAPPADPREELARLAGPVAAVTLLLEAIGAILLAPMFLGSIGSDGHAMGLAQSAWRGVFHSVSAFCNAGFSLYGESLQPLREHWQVPGVIGPLIVLGGLGLPVLQNLCSLVRAWSGRLLLGSPGGLVRPPGLALPRFSSVALGASVTLIVGGGLLLMILENINLDKNLVEKAHIYIGSARPAARWEALTPPERLRAAMFLSASARSAGFHTMDVAELGDASKSVLCGLMLVGGTPGGSAGGLGTVIVVLLAMIVLRGIGRADAPHPAERWAGADLAPRIVAMGAMYLALAAVLTLVLCVATRSQGRFLDVLLEACSACGGVGLSTGLTPTLNVLGKSAVIGGMLVGRLGVLAMLAAIVGLKAAPSRQGNCV